MCVGGWEGGLVGGGGLCGVTDAGITDGGI